VLEAGLGFAVDFDTDFIGREAVLAAGKPQRRLVQVLLADPSPLLQHGEIVYRCGAAVGYVRAASYGHTLGGAVGLAMVSSAPDPVVASWVDSGEWTVDVAGTRYPARASLRPLYDPTNARIRV
jgi:4-methylaminobutanoate oxidase (formaldehyde-forming)